MTDLYADDTYLDFYRFEHDPFAGRGLGFKFFADKRQSVLDELEHLARYSKLMLVVTGPKGSGKTVLRQIWVARAKEHVKSIVITASSRADAASMLQQVSTALNLPESDIAGVLGHIEQLLVMGQEVHLVVDNAEFLDESGLLFLQRIAQGVNDACARVFVFSDSSICPLLEKVADNADLHHVIALEPWDLAETTEYIGQRLVAAGQQFDMLTEQQLADVFAQSEGWPGRINNAAKDLLLEHLDKHSAAANKKTVTQIPYKHFAILVVLSVTLLLIWMMQTPESKREQEQAVQQDDSQGRAVELPLEVAPQPVLRAPLAQAVNAEDDGSAMLLHEDEHNLQAQRPASVVVSAPVPISAPRTEVVQEVVVQAAAPVAKKPVQPARPASTPAKPAVAPQRAPAASTGTAGHSQWYKQQAASRYTLQVLGTRSEGSAQSLVRQNTGQFHYFRKQHQGQALYVVTYGSFVNRAAALAALNNLPENIRKDKPWPRTMLSVQQEIR